MRDNGTAAARRLIDQPVSTRVGVEGQQGPRRVRTGQGRAVCRDPFQAAIVDPVDGTAQNEDVRDNRRRVGNLFDSTAAVFERAQYLLEADPIQVAIVFDKGVKAKALVAVQWLDRARRVRFAQRHALKLPGRIVQIVQSIG